MENLPLTGEQLTLREMPEYGGQFLTQEAKAKHRIIGQVFDTYWLVQFEDKLFIIDQHAAHEKVLFERTMASLEKKEYTSQQLSPPMVVSLNMREEQLLKNIFPNLSVSVMRSNLLEAKNMQSVPYRVICII